MEENSTPAAGGEPRGDDITVGDISQSTGIAIGRNAHASVTSGGATPEEIARAFAILRAKVDALPAGPDKQAAQSAVNGLQAEAAKGDQASESNVEKWFRFLAQTAPDAFEVAVATFTNPIAGLGLAFKKIAERAKE